ncbi:MAG: hypothetical protein LPK58_05950 [Gammaproteobacteria bacterium]|nr:hypothetical protein [Gammaproteobacteria bacterium]
MFRRMIYSLCLLGLTLVSIPAATQAADEVRDPMRPPAGVAAAAPQAATQWTLQSTAVAGGRRSAIINGQVVSVGGRVHGARVLAIQPGSVRLATAEGEITLRLPVYEIKKGAR